MKLIVSSTDLLHGVQSVAKAIPVKTAFPILENFLFVLKGNSLQITASDSELTLQTIVEVENAAEEGTIAIPATHIVNLLKELPDLPLTITTIGDSSFECDWGFGKSTLPYFPGEDYPEISGVDESALSAKFDAQSLVEAIQGTVYATADDEVRPAMGGILFDIQEGASTLVASDSHKLICYNLKNVQSDSTSSFILHKRPANVLKGLIGKEVESVSVEYDAKTAVFKFDNTMAICRLVVGKYPKYREVIPSNNPNILRITRSALLNAARRISVCANKASSQIKLDLRSDNLMISAQDLGFSIAGYENISCQYEGVAFSIGFKATFLIEILSNMTCDELNIKFNDGKRAALIIPAEGEPEAEKLCAILMPVMI